ncbi:MAG: ATP-binding protein [Bacteroidia bacterium]
MNLLPESVLDTLPTGICIIELTDKDLPAFRCIYANHRFGQLMHTHPDTIRNQLVQAVLENLFIEWTSLPSFFLQALHSHQETEFQQLAAQNPEIKSFKLICKPIDDLRLMIQIHPSPEFDLPEKDCETRLIEINQELEQFVFSISHDLQAPIRHIETYVKILRDSINENTPDDWIRIISKISGASERVSKMIGELLVYSRNRNALPQKTEFDAYELVLHLADDISSFHPDQKIEWEIQPLPVCFGDRNMITLVWENLISNAVKFSGKKEKSIIKISSVEHVNEVEFSISDNGVGFDMRFVDKLFHIFHRLHALREFHGTGIGLALSSRIIGQHHGKIWAHSKPGEGATFHFTLPHKGDFTP